MENNLLESRLNKILEEKKFNKNNKQLNNYLNLETGIIVNDYFLVLEFEEVDKTKIQNELNEQLKYSSKFDHIQDCDSNSIQYVAVYLWIFNLSAGQFMEKDENKIGIKIPVDFLTHNVLKCADENDSQTQPNKSKINLNNIFCLSKQAGEKSMQILNSNLDNYQIAIYTEKQIYVGHIENLLSQINKLNSNEVQTSNLSFAMYRVQLLIQKYSPSILSIKFHKLSPHHLAVLLDDQYFTVYNLQESLCYHEVQYNLAKIPRYGRGEEYNVIEQKEVKFVDFEFGGNEEYSIKNQINSNKLNVISDFDFLAVYFMTEDGHLYYQSPFLIKDMRIDRDLVEQLKSYLISELTLAKQHDRIEEKSLLLQSYLDLVDAIDSGDMIKECGQPIVRTKSFAVSQNVSQTSQIPILNTVGLKQLEEHNFKIQLNYIPTESQEEDDCQEDNQNSNIFGKSSVINPRIGKNVFTKSVVDRVLNFGKNNNIIYRKYKKFYKIQTSGSLHVFVLTKEIGNKTYSTVSSRFSPLPVMPTNIIQDYYSFRLITGEKAHLECPLIANINYAANKNTQLLFDFKQNSFAKLCQKSIDAQSLSNVCFSLMNRVYCINFKWLQNLIQSDLSDPRALYEENEENKSDVRVLVDSKEITSSSNINEITLSDLSFYSLISQDSIFLALIPSEKSSFKIKSFTLEYLSNYIQIQKSAKIITNTLQKLIESQDPSKISNGTDQNSKPLLSNNKKIDDLSKNEDLNQFEQQLNEYIKEHEKVVKENVSLIKDKYSEVLKKKEELENKKKAVEEQIHQIILKKEKEISESKTRITSRNASINSKLQEIAKMLKNPKIQQQVGENSFLDLTLCDNYSNEIKEYYDRLKNIQQQYENYFQKRSEFFSIVGNNAGSQAQFDQQLVDDVCLAGKRVQEHIDILNSQLTINKKSKFIYE